jgi:hypothetical protein
VREIESANARTVTREEQPTGQPLIYRVEMIADCCLRNLFTQNVGMVEQGMIFILIQRSISGASKTVKLRMGDSGTEIFQRQQF